MINSNSILEKKKFPYPYLTIENFFEEEFYKNIEADFPKRTEAGYPSRDLFLKNPYKVKRFHFETTYGDEFYSKLIARSNAFKLLHDFFYGEKFMKMFLDLFSKDIENEIDNGFLKSDIKNLSMQKDPYEVKKVFSKHDLKKNKGLFLYPRFDIGLGEVGYGVSTGGSGIHVDNPQRLISVLFYAGGYTKMVGGEHRIWKKNGKKIEVERIIQPKPNLLIASLQNNIGFHDVNPVKEILGSRASFYCAISCSVPIWKKIKVNDFNIKYNRQRCILNSFYKLKRVFQNLFFS